MNINGTNLKLNKALSSWDSYYGYDVLVLRGKTLEGQNFAVAIAGTYNA